jgi:hypothetical protein
LTVPGVVHGEASDELFFGTERDPEDLVGPQRVRATPAGGEGGREVVAEAIAWNRTSQPRARVTDVEVTWSEATGEFRTFEVWR